MNQPCPIIFLESLSDEGILSMTHEVAGECPPEFWKENNEWRLLAEHLKRDGMSTEGWIFQGGLNATQIARRLARVGALLKDPRVYPATQYALAGWLLSATLKELPRALTNY